MPTQKNFTTVFSNQIFKIEDFDVVFNNGHEKRMSRLIKQDSVVIVPVTDKNEILFIREYHPAINKTLLTLPGGRIDAGESPQKTAERELEEETGYKANNIEKITELAISPGYITQVTTGFLATVLVKTQNQLEETEQILLEPHPLTEIDSLISSGEIFEARDISLCLLAKKKLEKIQDNFKDFDSWNVVKKNLHYKESMPPLFKERDIWWCSVGINIGFEEDGKQDNSVRPVLVIKKFNRQMFLGVPLSTKLKDNKYYVKITVKGREVSALISQIRVFSSKRIWNKIAELDTKDYLFVRESVGEWFTFLPPPPRRESRG